MARAFARKLYASKEWIALRRNLIIKRGPVCAKCKRVIVDTSRLIGHHITELTPTNVNDPNVALNEDNVELVCFDCHNVEHGRYGYQKGHEVFIVYGPPLSGKKNLVNQMAEYGDMILDLDTLFSSLSGQPLYSKPENLRFNVFAIRDKIIDMIKCRYGSWRDAYVIGGYPERLERERLMRELGAELISCQSSREECYQRAAEFGEAGLEWRKWIDKWFDRSN